MCIHDKRVHTHIHDHVRNSCLVYYCKMFRCIAVCIGKITNIIGITVLNVIFGRGLAKGPKMQHDVVRGASTRCSFCDARLGDDTVSIVTANERASLTDEPAAP